MFGFPEAERSGIESHKKHYLKSVIFQVKFKATDEIDKNKDGITSIFKDQFPRVNDTKRDGVKVSFGTDKTPIVQSVSQDDFGFELRSADGNNMFSFSKGAISLTISGNAYKNYNNFEENIVLLKKVFGLCKITSFSRVAIRKLNIIEFEIVGESETTPMQIIEMILNPNLLSSSACLPKPERIQLNIQTINYVEENDRLNLRYGLVVSDANNKKGQILIDIDLFTVGDIPVSSLESLSVKINIEIFNIFNWAISEEAKEQLSK